jgi:hypothetical protein
MGRMAIIIVIGLSLTVGIVGYSLNNSKTGMIENIAGFDKYAMARNIAHTAVNMALRALDRNDSLFIAAKSMSTSVMGGSATVTISYPFTPRIDTMDLTASAKFMDTTRLMKLRLHRRPVPFPAIRQAVGLRIPNPNFNMVGTPDIDGHDHRMNGSPLPPSANDLPGVGVMNPADTSIIAPFAGKIDGSPKDIVGDTAITDPLGFVNDYIAAADITFGPGVFGGDRTWGSADAPVIVFCDGDVKFTGKISGYGIMVVRGKLTLAGTFVFRGLVLAYQDTEIDVSFSTGTVEVIGGLIAAGPAGSKFEMRGTSAMLYSREALDMAMYINKLQVYRVMRWYE